MSEQNQETETEEVFPYPKLIQTFNYFFPKQKGSPDIFTMENLRKFSRFAPYLTLILIALVFASLINGIVVRLNMGENTPVKYDVYFFVDLMSLFVFLIVYVWWLGAALFAKLVRRSLVIPLAMSFIDPLRASWFFFLPHFIGFIIGGLSNLRN